MRLICPGCGGLYSAEAWANDPEAREALAAMAGLPAPLGPAAIRYLGLFRSETRALTWGKVVKVLRDLVGLVESGHVQVQGAVARPCPARIWAAAIDEMLVKPGIKRPLKNHNYLRQVAWALADQADAAAEKAREMGGPQVRLGSVGWTPGPADTGESEIMRKMRELGRS